MFSNSDVLGLKTVLKVDLLHSLGLWSVDRSPPDSNGQKFDRWSVDQAVDQQSILAGFWAITASFWSHINKRSFGMFYARFLESFQELFFISNRSFSTSFWAKLPYQKSVYQEWFSWVFQKFFFELSTSISILFFLTQAWAFYSHIYLIGALFVRVFKGDQVLRLPSVPPSILRSCRGAASVNLWVHVVLFLREQVRDLQV